MIVWAPAADEGLGARVDAELDLLARGALGQWVLYAMVVAAVTTGLVWGLRRLTVRLKSRAADEEAWPDQLAAVLEVAVILCGALAALRPLVSAAPLVVGVLVVLGAIFASRVGTPWVRNVLAGLSLSRRRVFREGDVIAVGGREGVVVRIGLWRTVLQSEDGSRRSIPNRVVAGDEITVAATGGVARVRIDVELPMPASDVGLERIRQALLASPFRHPGGVVSVETSDGRTISAELETWARDRSEEVERRVTRRVLAVASEVRA